MSKKHPRKTKSSSDQEPELFPSAASRKPERPLAINSDDDLVLDDEDAVPQSESKAQAAPAEVEPVKEVEVEKAIPSPVEAPSDEDWELSHRPTASSTPSASSEWQAEADPFPENEEGGEEEERSKRERRLRRTEEPDGTKPAGPSALDKYGRLGALILMGVLVIGVFWTMLNRKPEVEMWSPKRKVSLPMEGNLIKVSAADSGWRTRAEGDRVSSKVDLLTKKTVYPRKLPQLTLKAESSSNGYLRVLFLGPGGPDDIIGDPRVFKITGGKVDSPPTGVKSEPDGGIIVTASSGIMTTAELQSYLASGSVRWSIELSESSTYQAKGDEWKKLGTFAVGDVEL